MPRAGDVVSGKYRLIHPLGIGGMGTVWRAEHVALKQQVALKVLHVRGAGSATIKRFQREAQIAASIRHRNIVYISDFGVERDDPYIVMELLSGVPLSERMVVGEPLSVATFLNLIEDTLQGLSAVHAAGVVHRDMKPENIFLVRESDGSMFPKLLDFGVSRSTERGQGHTITREGIVMGTPEYVSPEQARGRMADVRSDIYSLGAVMYEALAGRLPFQADNPADLIVAVLNATPLPLSTWRPELGPTLSDLVGRAIARDPELRFKTADEMRAALSALRTSEPQLATCFLPRRFLAPSMQDDDQAETGDLAVPPPPPYSRAPATAELRLPTSTKRRWMMMGAGLAVAVGLSFAFVGGHSNAHSLAPSASQTGARAGAPKEALLDLTVHSQPIPVVEPAEVIVELFGLPDDAHVSADGAPVAGSTLHFARGSGAHEIVVDAPGKAAFHVSHDADKDGRYAIALLPKKSAAKSRPGSPAKGAVGKRGLLRRPDF